ncbi:prolyl oligopeptidase family serine peptidase [Mesorhizobium sp. BAC0120]|uniref:alpha/beta hydrolase family protein n=1 Tax=Mesorhizobium sp. BAC0120 TaxID=3090670 RepID=UPI00298C4F33|nr:prolyl oligopeptidase family serine peptidase [Mesorhizobium sp. BAC0120]MDW6025668.1 prolyl oligopeptidase family serine peptidase [Mesorhizobium sp. BAC0120]
MLPTRRHLLQAAAAALLPPGVPLAAADEPKLIREDYALARQRFRTHLVKMGPAPDEPQPLSAPPGARRLDYRSGELTLTAWISENAEPAPSTGSRPTASRPAVLFLHGGNALWQGHWDLARPYVEAGYVAMMPAVRAENGLPGYFSGFYDETSDVLAAAELLRAQPGVDRERLFLAGHSVGGTLTLLAAMSTPIFRAAAAFSASPDARAFFRRFPEDIRFDTAEPQEFDMRSPLSFATSFKCPVLMLHGSEEKKTDAALRLIADRAEAAGLKAKRGIIEGSHSSAIPGETAESLRFFASV